MKKIAIVGAGGGIGLAMSKAMEDHDYVVLDSQTTSETTFEIKNYRPQITEIFQAPMTRKERRAKERKDKKKKP